MKRSAYFVVVVLAMMLSGCNERTEAKASTPAAPDTAAAAVAAGPGAEQAAPAKPATPAAARVGHRMQLDPVSADKFKLGPQGGSEAKSGGGK